MRFLGVRRFGGLYLDGTAVPRPTRPWLIDLSSLCPYPGLEPGDIADFARAPDMARWRLGDTPADDASALQWVVLEGEGQTLMVCDRVILVRISWDDLDEAGFVQGRPVAIDDAAWTCRLMSGGDSFRVPGDGFSGGAPVNEWDRLVAGDQAIEGLPAGGPLHLADATGEASRMQPHNQLWNWFGVNTWSRDPYRGRESARCCRGYRSARFFYLNTRSHRHEDIGWRPVLTFARAAAPWLTRERYGSYRSVSSSGAGGLRMVARYACMSARSASLSTARW